MNKLEAIEYLVSIVEYDTGLAFSCVREIIEDFADQITKDELDELIQGYDLIEE